MEKKAEARIGDAQFNHDLLNHLGAAKMNAEMLVRSGDLQPKQLKNAERILANLEKIRAMFFEAAVTVQNAQIDLGSGGSVKSESNSYNGIGTVGDPQKKKSVLLIDDSQDLGSLFTVVLKTKGYNFKAVQNEADALTYLAHTIPDLILLDYSLIGQTGPQLLDVLEKQIPIIFKKCKIVLFTGFGDQVGDPRVHAVEQKAMGLTEIVRLVENYCN